METALLINPNTRPSITSNALLITSAPKATQAATSPARQS
jgi:hypothetical protein